MNVMRVMLVPGFLSPRALLSPLKARLEESGHNVSLFKGWPTLTVFQYRDLLAQLRDEGPAVVIGHSLGGMIAVLAAERRPDLLKAVIGLDPFIFDPVDIECPYFEVRGLEYRLCHPREPDGPKALDRLLTWAPHALVPIDPEVMDYTAELINYLALPRAIRRDQ